MEEQGPPRASEPTKPGSPIASVPKHRALTPWRARQSTTVPRRRSISGKPVWTSNVVMARGHREKARACSIVIVSALHTHKKIFRPVPRAVRLAIRSEKKEVSPRRGNARGSGKKRYGKKSGRLRTGSWRSRVHPIACRQGFPGMCTSCSESAFGLITCCGNGFEPGSSK